MIVAYNPLLICNRLPAVVVCSCQACFTAAIDGNIYGIVLFKNGNYKWISDNKYYSRSSYQEILESDVAALHVIYTSSVSGENCLHCCLFSYAFHAVFQF